VLVSQNFTFLTQGRKSDKIKIIIAIPAIENNSNYLLHLVFSYLLLWHKKTELSYTQLFSVLLMADKRSTLINGDLTKLWPYLNKQVISYVYLHALEIKWVCVFEYLHTAYVGDIPGVTCDEHNLNIYLDLFCNNKLLC